MKILIPFRDIDRRPWSSPVISGGIERFIKHVAEAFPEEVNIVEADGSQTIYADDSYDLVICNYTNPAFNVNLMNDESVPVAWICHHTAGFAPDWRDTVKRMREFTSVEKNSLWMVSEYQHSKWRSLDFAFPHVAGYVEPSFVAEKIMPMPQRYDVASIARCDRAKDPFKAHRVAEHAKLYSVVMSNSTVGAYFGENTHWDYPQMTFWNMPHDKVMSTLSTAGAYLSTWPGETFGITALEALARGIPVVMCSKDGDHASRSLLYKPEYGWTVDCNDVDAVAHAIMNIIYGNSRRDIAESTFERFNGNRWRRMMREMFTYSIERGKAEV